MTLDMLLNAVCFLIGVFLAIAILVLIDVYVRAVLLYDAKLEKEKYKKQLEKYQITIEA